MKTVNLYTPIELAKNGKLGADIDLFIDDWLGCHDVYEHEQCRVIRKAIKEFGWDFFHRELFLYCLGERDKFRVYDDGHVQIIGKEKSTLS